MFIQIIKISFIPPLILHSRNLYWQKLLLPLALLVHALCSILPKMSQASTCLLTI